MIKLFGQACQHAKALLFFAIFILGVTNVAWSQSLLDQPISISLRQQRLTESLKEIGRKGNFYFSYNGNLFSKDSLIDVEARSQPIREILVQLLGNGKYELEEKDNYVIITLAQQHLQMIDTDMSSEHNTYSASGIVINERTGERLANVSVYEKRLLAATLTDDHGYFRLRFKATDPGVFTLTASKVFYRDTTISFLKTVIVNQTSKIPAMKIREIKIAWSRRGSADYLSPPGKKFKV